MTASFLTIVDVFMALVGIYLLSLFSTRRNRANLPPGPAGFPIVGNLFDMPESQGWKVFTKWANMWGGLIHVRILGQPMIIVNSVQAAIEMLDKKSAIYSDRPVFTMSCRLLGWDKTLALAPYGERFRTYRHMLHGLMGTRMSVEKFHHIEELETRRFLLRVLQNSKDVAKHIRKTAGAIILVISHGYHVKEHNDPLVANADIAMSQFSRATAPTAFLVDVLPFLRHLPGWLPGTGWKQTAKEWAASLERMADTPHQFVKEQIAAGIASPSFASSYLDRDISPEDEFNVKWVSASLYAGGADTTVSAIYTFILAMTLYPEVQRKAQAELDTVVGTDRLPSYNDRDDLPYINALVKEVLRWGPGGPLGVPHRLMEDDIQDGYFIPKGSIIIANVWKFLHDETIYKDPMEFNPERFIASSGKEPELDPYTLAFGFGRRICPGMHIADASLYISCAMMLSMFDISKSVENGVIIEPVCEYTSGTISHPKPFKCAIEPRSGKAEAIIKSVDLLEDE